MKTIQQELLLFPAPSFEEIITTRNIPKLTITFNKRLRKSWHLIVTPDKQKVMTIPCLLKDAPKDIKESIIEWALLAKPYFKRKRKQYYQQKRELENKVWAYLEKYGALSRQKRVMVPEQFTSRTKGVRYDLKEIFDQVNQHYFNGKIKSSIRWEKYASKTSYQSYFNGPQGSRHNLITIAGAYNHPKVPEFVIRGVVFHEMLHILYPRYKRNGRNVIHGPEFKKAEYRFLFRDKWYKWEKENMYKIIRSLKITKRNK